MNNIDLYGFIQGSWHLTEIITYDNSKVIYCGKACSATASEDSPSWCIKRITMTTVDSVQTIVEEFAGGKLQYDNVWANRKILNYKFLI